VGEPDGRCVSYRLVENPDEVSVLADEVSESTGIPKTHIEKDFWVTEVLRGVVGAAHTINATVIFKGGTSLSKAYKIIERFSEDIDMLLILPEGTKGNGDRILKNLVQGAVDATAIGAEIVSGATTKGEKRGARFHYRTTNGRHDGLKEGVLLEIGTRGGVMPTTTHQIVSLIAEHAGNKIADAIELSPVDVLVQHPSRTLVEKLVLLHTAHYANDLSVAIKAARHYYDIHKLLSRLDVLKGVSEVGITILARDVCTYSTSSNQPAKPRPPEGFASSPAFINGQHMAAVRTEYDTRVLGQLLWPNAERPSLDECIETVQRNRDHL